MTETIVSNVKRIGEGLYQVASETVEGRSYTVDLKTGVCQCPHAFHRLRGRSDVCCKHVEAARAKCQAVTAAKARTIPDVTIDELACKYEAMGRLDISAVLYDEILRRNAERQQEQVLKALFS